MTDTKHHPAPDAGQRAHAAYCDAIGVMPCWDKPVYTIQKHAWAAVEAALAAHPLEATSVASHESATVRDNAPAVPEDIEALAAWAESEVPACDDPADYTQYDRQMIAIAAALRRLAGERNRGWAEALDEQEARGIAEAERDALREALTPSGETKAAYIGEFVFKPDGSRRSVVVPWTTVKEIMAAISARAALAKGGQP